MIRGVCSDADEDNPATVNWSWGTVRYKLGENEDQSLPVSVDNSYETPPPVTNNGHEAPPVSNLHNDHELPPPPPAAVAELPKVQRN